MLLSIGDGLVAQMPSLDHLGGPRLIVVSRVGKDRRRRQQLDQAADSVQPAGPGRPPA
jgi:flagellar biosynthesis component FlhA